MPAYLENCGNTKKTAKQQKKIMPTSQTKFKFSKTELVLFFCLILDRIGSGYWSTIPTTTVLDLGKIFATPVDEISKFYGSRSIGCILGVIFNAVYMEVVGNSKFCSSQKNNKSFFTEPLNICSIIMLFIGITTSIIPLMPYFSHVKYIVIMSSLCYGFLDLCLQSACIQIWGPELSKPLVQAYHGLWGFGSIVAPYIAAFFSLGEKELTAECEKNNESLGAISHNISTNDNIQGKNTMLWDEPYELPNIFWPWFFCGSLFFVAGLVLFQQSMTGARQKIQEMYQQTSEDNAELELCETEQKMLENSENKQTQSKNYLKYELILVFLMFCSFFCNGGPEHWYIDHAFNWSRCIKNWSKNNSTLLISSYWGFMFLGRMSGVILSNKISAKNYILLDGIFVILTYLGLWFFRGNSNFWLIFIISGVNAISYSTLYANLVALSNQYFDPTKLYSVTFGLGNFAGQSLVTFAGNIVLKNSSKWLLIGSAFSSGVLIFPVIMVILGDNFLKRKKLNKS